MSDDTTIYTYLDIVHGREITVELAAGEEIYCPNCGGTGDDPDTMICCMCGGEGVLTADDEAEGE